MIKFDKRNYRKHNDRNKELIKKSLEECGEIWVDVKGYEGLYKVSNKGRIKSLARGYKNQYGEFGAKKEFIKTQKLNCFNKENKQERGYYVVNLARDDRGKWVRVHRLVAEAFIPNPENKKEVNHKDRNKTDLEDNFDKDNVVVFARNAMFDIAKDLGLDYFMVLDDDYDHFCFRRCYGSKLKGFKIKDLNSCIWAGFDYLDNTPKLDCFTWCQDGDFIGGADSFESIGGKRKIMNAYFFRTERPIKFLGRTNEDLTASVYNGQRGMCLFTVNDVSVHQMITQKQGGGAY